MSAMNPAHKKKISVTKKKTVTKVKTKRVRVPDLERDIAEVDALIKRGEMVLQRLRERIIGFEVTLQWARDQAGAYVDPSEAGKIAVMLECTKRDIDECKADWHQSEQDVARLKEIREIFEEMLIQERLSRSRFLDEKFALKGK